MPYVPPEPPVPFAMPYPGARLRWALDVIGWSYNYFAERMEIDRGSVRQMFKGSRYIPDTLGYWIESLAQLHVTFDKPMGWLPKPDARPDDPDEAVSPDTILLD